MKSTWTSAQLAALQRSLHKFGLIAVSRTGRISLKRGSALLEMGGWGDGALRARNAAETPAGFEARQRATSAPPDQAWPKAWISV